MSFAWVFNLDAELELQSKTYNAPALLRDQLAEHGRGSRALMGEDDVIAAPGNGSGRTGRAWCPTKRALALLRASGAEPEPHPSEVVLRRVNHRLFAHELGGGLSGQRWVTTRREISGDHILLKRPLAFAGRGQLRIEGPLTAKQEDWIGASLRKDGLIVEPFAQITRELSQHGFIWQDGRFELGHVCEQETTARGVFLAMRRTTSPHPALPAERVAVALVAAGYFGPFGIDAYEHRGGFCALSEINARYTMGFAVGFPRHASTLSLL